jgi:hypothetical protein
MHMAIDRAIVSMPISALWGIFFSTHMSAQINTRSQKLGIPDLLLGMDGPGDNIDLWIVEVSFSQTEDDLMRKIRRYTTECEGVQVITMVDICESQPYKKPKESSELANAMKERDLLTLKEWKVASDNPAFGPVISSVQHQWASPLTVSVKTWLRHSSGEFSLEDTDNSMHYACAVRSYWSIYI